MSFVAVAVGVGTVAVGAYSAVSASNSAADANAQNAKNVSDTNQLNYQQFLQSRGSTGSAIYPIYAKTAEEGLYNDALSVYDATGAIQPTAADYQKIVSGAQPGADAAAKAAAGIFDGSTLNTELAQQQPVSDANLALAQTQKQGSLEALQTTLNNIKSIQAGKGYAGDSFGNSLLRFNATQQANTAGAQAVAGANLANARSVQGIQENAVNRELQNPNAISNAVTQKVNLAQLPTNALAKQQVDRQNLFANFRIGTGQPFQYSPLPLVTPTASTGQIAGQAVGALANGVGNYYTNQQLSDLIKSNSPAVTLPTLSGSDSSLVYRGSGNPVIPSGEQLAAEEAL